MTQLLAQNISTYCANLVILAIGSCTSIVELQGCIGQSCIIRANTYVVPLLLCTTEDNICQTFAVIERIIVNTGDTVRNDDAG